jgi:hypothetical protein
VLQKLVGSLYLCHARHAAADSGVSDLLRPGQLDWIQERWDAVWPWTHFKEPFFCALLAFS